MEIAIYMVVLFLGGMWTGWALRKTNDEVSPEAMKQVAALTDPYQYLDFAEYVRRQIRWSRKALGEPSEHDTVRLHNHIQKELLEILQKPKDTLEWIDVIILAIDGAWRNGSTPHEIAYLLQFKQDKNIARKWPKPSDPTQPIEHDRTGEVYCERETNP